ncbi:penicillin-binding protein 2 [Haloechinothrix sp. LS1_15]|uniref:peptidoglycan D,D-transpeptidase FtsI family protein n=1 Tax=Haloechinothrix sp. LS1_15 TaxID=2652248 RepID=UPI002947CEC6|nr:penicillin-binding protein 2 [Haloechinothrix sp. LS1_15]MDV6010905.1 penicillin-binding protein 2 [Haloechinothrix sp. LS1_15]
MNTPLRRVGIAMLAMIVLLLGHTTYIQVFKADSYRADQRNQRVLLDEYSRERGQIVSQFDGQVLAHGERTGGRLQYLRTYPNGPMYAPVTGYYSWRYGAAGLERAQNDILSGNDARLFVRRLSDMITGRDPRGGHVQVTINPEVQRTAYDLMSQRGYTGAVVALEPNSGEILGLVSTPSYDPNELSTHDGEAQETAWTSMSEDPAKPMANRAIRETYPPGSTFKLVTTAAALEDGADADTEVNGASSITLPGTQTQLQNFAGQSCPGTTLQAALAYSCNTAFAEIAGELGAEKLRATAENFGIGHSDLDIPMRVARSSLGELDGQAELYQSGIGQRDIRLTPLQVAQLAATVANDGVAMQPRVVSSLLAPDLSTIEEFGDDELTGDPAMSAENAEILHEMMLESEENTAGGGKRDDLTIASKTGTAEHGPDPKNTPPHAWYTAYAPADDPEIAVAVLVESGGDHGLAATGGTVAAEVGRLTIDVALGGGEE